MAEPTDFKNREYKMLRIDARQEYANKEIWQDIKQGGWEMEPTPEWTRLESCYGDPFGPITEKGDGDPIFVLSYSRPHVISP